MPRHSGSTATPTASSERCARAVPIGLDTRVPAATRRQANCYYSSSDAAFADRYHAYSEYDRALAGKIPLDGGWRVYSSGAGIGIGLMFRCFLGLRLEPLRLVIDPAIPKGLDGLRAELELGGMRFEITYRIEAVGCGVLALELNGRDLPFMRRPHPYRSGGAEVSIAALRRDHGRGADSADGPAGVNERGGALSSWAAFCCMPIGPARPRRSLREAILPKNPFRIRKAPWGNPKAHATCRVRIRRC